MEEKVVNIANFNCTFGIDGRTYPMLKYFQSLLFPAITSGSFARKGKNGSFYLTDVELVDISNDKNVRELALIGKHIRKVVLDIRNDFEVGKGLIHVGERRPSAPFSTFILLLRNHRLIHYRDQAGSPDVRSLAVTFEVAMKSFRKKYIKTVVEQYEETGEYPLTETLGEISKKAFPTKAKLNKYLYDKLPLPVINIIPIPDKDVVESTFSKITKITELNFRFFSLNSELQVNGLLQQLNDFSDEISPSSGNLIYKNPTKLNRVEKAVEESRGLTDIKISAFMGKDKVTLSTDSFTENIPLKVPVNEDLVYQAKDIYSNLNSRRQLRTTSDENKLNYAEFLLKVFK